MNVSTLRRVVAIGTLTGMRSMAGVATIAAQRGGLVRNVAGLLAAGEMVADKTSVIGDRTDPMPLAGRAAIGAVGGAIVARQERQAVVRGALVGAGAGAEG